MGVVRVLSFRSRVSQVGYVRTLPIIHAVPNPSMPYQTHPCRTQPSPAQLLYTHRSDPAPRNAFPSFPSFLPCFTSKKTIHRRRHRGAPSRLPPTTHEPACARSRVSRVFSSVR